MDGLMEALVLELLPELPPYRPPFAEWGLGFTVGSYREFRV